MILEKSSQDNSSEVRVSIVNQLSDTSLLSLSEEENSFLQRKYEQGIKLVDINRYSSRLLVVIPSKTVQPPASSDCWRRLGNDTAQFLKKEKIISVDINSIALSTSEVIAFVEGIALGSYQFSKYQTNTSNTSTSLQRISLSDDAITGKEIAKLTSLISMVYLARDLVNEPVITLNSEKLSALFVEKGKEFGVKTEVFLKEKIESLKMGGLLAVNKGSVDPPTFTILEWSPENPVFSDPIVLVGKGVVFDTGGLSLKPTAKSMDYMKSDMAGAAAAACSLFYAAQNNIPLRLIALIPATDNRPGGNAVTPGDVIKMHSGATVEVLNTDAEGRLLLADALSYAKQYNPKLVIDLATLTGSAAMTLGIHGIAAMRKEQSGLFEKLLEAGENVRERLVELPLWDEYDEMIKSNIADMKNIGGSEAGAITAGKFLERFVDYPWIHLDIAGPAFLHAADQYRPTGGTGTGVRLLVEFFNLLARD